MPSAHPWPQRQPGKPQPISLLARFRPILVYLPATPSPFRTPCSPLFRDKRLTCYSAAVSNLITESWDAISDAFSVPLILASTLASLVLVLRAASWVWYLTRQRGRRPLVIRMDFEKEGQADDVKRTALSGKLLAYLAADGHGDYVIAPGGGGRAAPRVAAEALEPDKGWETFLLRLAVTREPSYVVDATWSEPGVTATEHNAVVRISRVPGDRVVASRSFTEESNDDLVKAVGCFCIAFFRDQPQIKRNTPRWERWSEDINGYRAYREGLFHQKRVLSSRPIARSPKRYRIALSYFHEAARIEPGNLLVQLHRASLLELMHQYDRAVDIYEKCSTLWPDHIETKYRLHNARKNARMPVVPDELLTNLQSLKRQLLLRNLAKAWFLTYRLWRWNPGERKYWASWLQVRLPRRVTKRAAYRHAISVSVLIAKLSSQLGQPAKDSSRVQTRELMKQLAKEIRGKSKESAYARLLYPEGEHRVDGEKRHSHDFHAELKNAARINPQYSRERRRNIGWLAHFNAACFFSLAMKLPKSQLPEDFSEDDWKDDCARAAILEIGILVRDPRSALEPDWLGTDNDLEPLRTSRIGKEWLQFVGLNPARPPQIVLRKLSRPRVFRTPLPGPRSSRN
jgi:tetratricopeptide (TPR) repeat protein